MEERSLIHGPRVSAASLSLSSQFKELSWSSPFAKRIFLVRGVLVAGVIAVGVVNAFTGYFLPTKDVECIWDGLFEATASLNTYLRNNESVRSLLLTFSSALIDFLMLVTATRFLFLAKTWRTILFLVTFYGIRAVVMSVFILRFPEGHAFLPTGFPSLMVSYAHTSDFFYSGHVGFATFAVLENYQYENYALVALAVVTVVVESVMMILTRAHYTIDIVAGIVFAHYLWIVTGWLSPYIDKKLVPATRTKEEKV